MVERIREGDYKRQGEGVIFKEKYRIIFQNCWKEPALDPGTEGLTRTINKQRARAGVVRWEHEDTNGNFLLRLLDGVQKQQGEGK